MARPFMLILRKNLILQGVGKSCIVEKEKNDKKQVKNTLEEFMRLRNIPGAKDAIEESVYVIQNPVENKGHWDQVFPEVQPIHLEVGMGKGRFLMDLARIHPKINYIGIEMYDSVLLRALQKKEALAQEGQELPKSEIYAHGCKTSS